MDQHSEGKRITTKLEEVRNAGVSVELIPSINLAAIEKLLRVYIQVICADE